MISLLRFTFGLVFATALFAGPFSAVANDLLQQPTFIRGGISHTSYDGVTNDLLTGGLGKSGLQAAAPPAFVDPSNPTAGELRTRAIYVNYRALVDAVPAGGYGTLYGPNIDRNGQPTLGEGKISGDEYIAFSDNGTGRKNVTLMVQVPTSFDPKNPCIVTGTSSGSRGIYGAIGTSGEWGLKHGCAVAYTDKGTGNGLHDLHADKANKITGELVDANSIGKNSIFTAPITDAQQTAFNSTTPNRVAYKHAHSQQNPESDWGKYTLQAVKFAFYILNLNHTGHTKKDKWHPLSIHPKNTIVIASSASNGAGAALAAAEQDFEGLIDGVAISEPQIQVHNVRNLVIKQGNHSVQVFGRPLFDYFTLANLYQPCAALAPSVANPPGTLFLTLAGAAPANRCTALKAKGLLSGTTLTEQANESLDKLHAYGWLPDSDILQWSHYRLATNAIVTTYANSYGRFSVVDNLCGYSFGNTDAAGNPVPQVAAVQAAIFGTGNGVPPTSGVNIIYNDAQGGPRVDLLAVSPSSGFADFALDGALCHRSLATGIDTNKSRLTGIDALNAFRIHLGLRQVQVSADLNGKPAVIVHGRSDALIPVNHASRAYYGKNHLEEGRRSRVRYIEVTNAQHFDAFIDNALLPGYDSRFVPLHHYFLQALDFMYAHLRNGTPLPGSQVVRTVPRGGTPGAAPAITTANVPSIAVVPAAADAITFSGHTLNIPD